MKVNDIVIIKSNNITGKIVNISKDNFGIEVITILTKTLWPKYVETLRTDLMKIWE